MFTLNELVIYPDQGIGIIERIDRQEINGVSGTLYIVRIRSNNITLMVPTNNADKVGLRSLVSKDKADHILQWLRDGTDKTVCTGQNWNRRFREYSDRLKNRDLHVVTEVLRELLLIGKEKELSFGERRLQEQAMNLVTGELAEVLEIPKQALREELFNIYDQYCRQKTSPVPDGSKGDVRADTGVNSGPSPG
ncbi:MAG: CarD family transcriptional regulator [Desulfovibrio sp.]|jgi:CarD family transcriptional regulator|nr:CarD family transcriptional regulator [Desulfovibrio sp.]